MRAAADRASTPRSTRSSPATRPARVIASRSTPDGLIACGEPGVQLTWMDAKVGDEVVTPRIGKPVEIQALWLNALAIVAARDPKWRATLAVGSCLVRERSSGTPSATSSTT